MNGVDAHIAGDNERAEFRGHRHEEWLEIVAGSDNDPGRKNCVGCARVLGREKGDRWRCKGRNGERGDNGGKCDLVVCGTCRYIVVGQEVAGRVGELRYWNARQGRVG